jgi:hypothetical protein
MTPTQNAYQPLLKTTAKVNTSRIIIFTCRFSTAVGVVLDVIIGRQLVQPFRHTNISKFLQLPLECRKLDTSHLPTIPRASPVAFGNQEMQHIQPIRNNELVTNRF